VHIVVSSRSDDFSVSRIAGGNRPPPARASQKGEQGMTEPPDLESIRLRAYELWERSGKIEGEALQFWLQAERELTERHQKDDVKTKSPDRLEGGLE
jgi:hypothetical protein